MTLFILGKTGQVAEGQRLVQELEVVGVLENEYAFILLDSLCEEYILPVEMYSGSLEELIERLPFKVSVESMNKRVLVELTCFSWVPQQICKIVHIFGELLWHKRNARS
ncbi:hypothetical protein Q7C36_001896 [Tachysurus vachellii]|uniref:Uncharacterized protein n=1 Tax=Tachysurus vachellii TaxID=175792 RepID=A0AA88NY30_TACVA|nr:hypothetical protein Q7C36_001896 [Tachysurus vachellii]